MHPANAAWWKYCVEKYPHHLNNKDSNIIEFGSFNENGSLRDFITNYDDYIGIDWRAGPRVDVVSLAHEYKSDKSFDAVLSASMLEHDPFWSDSITNMVSFMKNNSILILSWGSALNTPHYYHVAPDGKFHSLKAGLVINLLQELGLNIHEFVYESTIANSGFCTPTANGNGEACLVAAKFMCDNPRIDELFPEDKI